MWSFPAKISIPLYTASLTAILLGWLLELNYWLYQNEADGMCSFWVDESDVTWWGISLFSIVFQILYLFYLDQKLGYNNNCTVVGLSSLTLTLLSQLMCMSNVYLSVSTPLFYWLSKLLFIGMLYNQVALYYQTSGAPYLQLAKEDLKQLMPGKRFFRDLFVMFIIVHYSMAVLVDILSLNPVVSLSYITNFVGDWCTSLIIVAGLSEGFAFLSNVLISISRFIVTGEKAFAAAVYDVDIGGRISTVMLLFYLEADISSTDDTTRQQCLKYVMFLTFDIILTQVWDMTQEQCFKVLNSRETHKPLACLRVFIFAAIVTIIPTLLTVNLAAYIQVNVWLLLIATGNAVLLWRAFGTFLEVLITVSAPNSTERDIERRDDTLYYVRLVKNLVIAVASLMPGYCRLLFPFFPGRFYVRIFIVICEAITMFKLILYKEWIGYFSRRKLMNVLDTFPVATTEQLQELNDVCAICLDIINEGRVIKCSHIYHRACLRQLFQTKNTCPKCNDVVF